MFANSSSFIPYYLFLSAISLMVLLSLSGCRSSKDKMQEVPDISAKPFLIFQKTPCYGPCSAYEAKILENGTVQFIDWQSELREDTLLLAISKKNMKALQKQVQQLDYSAWERAYLSGWSDMPTTYLTFYKNGKEVKRVKHQEGGPENLLDFMNSLHELIMHLTGHTTEDK